MRVVIEISPSKGRLIQNLVESGKYSTLQQFVFAAIDNQLLIEEQENIEVAEPSVPARRVDAQSDGFVVSADGPVVGTIRPVREPALDEIYGSKLWTLHNRIFPVKVTVRLLAKLLEHTADSEGYVDAEVLEENAIKEATRLGKLLDKEDRQRKTEQKLSTGLITKPTSKSCDRFRYSFIGSVIQSKNGQRQLLDGAPGRLRFINVRTDQTSKKLHFGLTSAGYRFATMRNPILDDHVHNASLSADEADFYLDHISRKLPQEYDASMTLLEATAEGKNTPSSLASVSNDDDATRASQISRLVELGLVNRTRIGIHVRYSVTDRGRRYLEQLKKSKTALAQVPK